MDQQTRFYFFFAALNLVILFLDLYVLHNWKKFINSTNKNKLLWQVPLAVSLVFTLISYINSVDRMNHHTISIQMSNLILLITNTWFLPKIFIVPFILLIDIKRIFIWIFKKITNNNIKLINKEQEYHIDNLVDNLSDNKNSNEKLSEQFSEKISENNNTSKLTRRELIQNYSWGLASLPFFFVSYGSLYSTKNTRVLYQNYKLYNLPTSFNNFKILQVSDLHLGSLTSPKVLYDIILSAKIHKPDIILITGDFVNSSPIEMYPYVDVLKQLDAKYGVYGCLGNHDHYMTEEEHIELLTLIDNSGIKLITNDNLKLYIGNEFINIAGVDNWGMRQQFGDFDKVNSLIDYSTTSILMCHDPNNWRKFILNKMPIDITLSGHTHGGQMGFESDTFNLMPVSLVYEFYAGSYNIGDQYLYVNRGMGTTGPPIRLGIEPEITIITLNQNNNLT